MRIQWNSDTAQEMLERLRGARQGLEEGKLQADRVRGAMAEANAQGDNRAIKALEERFERCSRHMETLAREIEDFRDALRRADETFDDAERSNRMLIDALEEPPLPGVGRPFSSAGIRDSGVYYVLRDSRFGSVPVPEWLLHLL